MADGNKVNYGITNVFFATLSTERTEEGIKTTYKKPKRLYYAKSISLEPKGDTENEYADNMIILQDNLNLGYEGELEFASLDDDFKKEIMGYTEDKNGVLIENKNDTFKPFALLFQFEGDKEATRHILYNVSTERVKVESTTTTDKKDKKTEVLKLKANPSEDLGDVKGKVKKGSEVYEKWFEEVYIKKIEEIDNSTRISKSKNTL